MPRSRSRSSRRGCRLHATLAALLSTSGARLLRAEDVCAFFSTPESLALLDGIPPGADLAGCAAFLHDATPVCQLQCDTGTGAYRFMAGTGAIRCNSTELLAGTNSKPPFVYTGTLSCEDLSGGLTAQLVMAADLANVTAGQFIPANVTVQSAAAGGETLPVLAGQVCAQLVATPGPDNDWAYLRAAEVQDVSLVAFASYSRFYEDNPADPLEVLPLVAADVELNATLVAGSFALELVHKKKAGRSPPIVWNASAGEVQDALQELEEVHMVSVTKTTAERRRYEELGVHPFGTVVTGVTFTTTWSVTFRGGLAGSDLELLSPVWSGRGCPECEAFGGTDAAAVSVTEAVPGSFWPCAPFVDGVATFRTLQVNEPGTHAVHYFFDRWQVDGPEFAVSVGPVAAITMLLEPGTVYGGTPFASQPVLAATDLGGNAVPSVSYGSVTASLLFQYAWNEAEVYNGVDGVDAFNYSAPHQAPNSTLSPAAELTRRFDQGVASFRQLAVDKPGLYALKFLSTLDVEWPYVIHHRQRVGVGRPARLGVRAQPTAETAGVPFATQPIIELQDAAGNVVEWDSESRVVATIERNPCEGNSGGGSGAMGRSLFNRDWALANTSGCGTLMRSEVQRLSVYLANVDPANVSFVVGFRMGVKVTTAGQFDRFDYYGPDGEVEVPFAASADEMRAALESLPGLGFVTVNKTVEEGSGYSLADWEVTFVSDKGNVPALRLGCLDGVPCSAAFNGSVSNASAPYMVAVEVEEVVHGCLSLELCLDQEDFYVDHLAATAVDGVATFHELSIDTAGSGYTLRFELEGSDGAVAVVSELIDISVGEPAYLAARPTRGTGTWANGEAPADPPVVVLWDAGFNRIAPLSTEDGFVVASVAAGGDAAPTVPAFLARGADTVCTDSSASFVPSHWLVPGAGGGVCRAICAASDACSGFMTNSTAASLLAVQGRDSGSVGGPACALFVNGSTSHSDNRTAVADGLCPAATFTVTTDWNRTAFAANGVDLALGTDDAVADRPSQLYDFWSQEAGGGYAVVTVASPCTPTDVVAARAFHVVQDNAAETAEWQAALETFLADDVAAGSVVMASLEWEDLANCDDWQGTGAPAVACPASSPGLAGLLGATVTAADVAACNAACGARVGGNCSYALVAVKGLDASGAGPNVAEFLNCTRVAGCGFEVLYAGGGCQSDEYQTFAHAEVLVGDYTVDECYEACRDIAWCEQFAAGAANGRRKGDCLVYSGQCSSQSDDATLVTYQMLPCAAEATVDLSADAGWEYRAATAWNASGAAAVAAAGGRGATTDVVQAAVSAAAVAGAGVPVEGAAGGYQCFQRDFHPLFDVRAGKWTQELRHGWANFSTMGFARPGNYRVQYDLVRFAVDDEKGSGYRCPAGAPDAAVHFAGFTESASACQARCVDLGDECRFAVYWSGRGATGFCELCDAPEVLFRNGYYRGSAAALVPVDGADAREGRRPVSDDRYPTTVYVRRVYGDNLREVVDFDVRSSAEFVARAETPHAGELLGASVAVGEGGVVVAGAYGSSVPTYEVQYLRTTGTSNAWVSEVQVLQVGVREHSHEVQAITLAPYHHEEVGGAFTVSWNGRGPSRALPFDVSAVQMEKILEEDLAGVGDLEVTRLDDWQCEGGACLHQWQITFVTVNETYLGCHAFSDGEGTARDGTACAYPFKVGDKLFTSCANGREEGGRVAAGGDPDRYWCSTTFDFDADRRWGFCECPEFGTWPEVTVDGAGLEGNTTCVDVWTRLDGQICQSYTFEAINLDRAACEAYALERGHEMFSFGVVENSTQCLLCDTTALTPTVAFNTSNHSLTCSYDHPVLTATTTQHAAVIAGHFTLLGEGNSSVEVAWNETRDALLAKIEGNLLTTDYLGNLSAIDLVDVNRGLPDAQGGYTWTVTFSPSDAVYDVPELRILGQGEHDPDECLCEGNCCNDTEGSVPGLLPEGNTEAAVWTLVDGRAPLGEWFNLFFQGAGPTGDIPFNATAEEMEYALQQLPTIDDVDVAVAGSDTNTDKFGICRAGTRCHEWSVTFRRTRRLTDYGWVIDEFGNLPPLEADLTLLAGTGADVAVDYLYEGSRQLGQRAIRGDDGTRAGSVYVFVPRDVAAEEDLRSNAGAAGSTAWAQQARLTASDAAAFDMFGFSVAVDAAVGVGFSAVDRPARVVVGAPGHAHAGHTADVAASFNQSVGAAYVFERRLGRPESDYGSANDTRHPDDETTAYAYDWVEVQMLQPEDEPSDAFGWGFGEAVAVREDSIAVGAPQESAGAGAVYIYHVENAVDDPQFGSFVEIQRLTNPDVALAGYVGGDADGDNATAPAHFGSVVVFEDDLLAVAAPGMYDGLGAVFLYQWVENLHSADPEVHGERPGYNASSTYRHYAFLQRLLFPGAAGTAATATAAAALGRASGFAQAVALTGEFVVVGAPTALDGVGQAFVFSRREDSLQFELAQVLAGTDAYANGHFGVDVAVHGHTVAVTARQASNEALGPAASVQLVTVRAAAGVDLAAGGSTFALGFRQAPLAVGDMCYRDTALRCPPEEMNFRCYACAQDASGAVQFITAATPRLPNDASAEAVRGALEALGTGPLRVARTQQADAQGGYAWAVTFLDPRRFAARVPPLEAFSGELQGAPAGSAVVVEVLADAPQRDEAAWSAVYAFTTPARLPWEVASGAHPFVEQGVAMPQNAQHADHYGSAVDLRGGVLAVGALNRAASPLEPDLHAGAVFVDRLHLLDVAVEHAAYNVSEAAVAVDIVSRRCSGECVPPTAGQSLFEDLGPQVEGQPLVHFAGHSLRCYSPADLGRPNTRVPAADSVDSTCFSPYVDSVSEGVAEWTLRLDGVSAAEPLRVGVAATHSVYAANHSGRLANEATESYGLPTVGYAYEAQTGRVVNYSAPLGAGAAGLEFGSAVYGPALRAGDLLTVRLTLNAASTGTLEFVVNGASVGVAARGLYDAAGAAAAAAVGGGAVVSYRLMVGITCGGTNDGDAGGQNAVSLEEAHDVVLMFATGDEVSDSEVDPLLLRRAAWYLANEDGRAQYLPYGTATGDAACRTSLDAYACLWKSPSGVYDFDAELDYAPANGTVAHVARDFNHQEMVSVMVTNDDVVEVPDEFLNIVWWLPGFAPSLPGHLWSQVTIADDGDGAVGLTSYSDELFTTEAPAEGDFAGSCVAAAGSWVVVGSHLAGDGAGAVTVFFDTLGVWTQTQVLTNEGLSPPLLTGAVPGNQSYFGASVDLDLDNRQLIVGAYGEGAAYVFALDDPDSAAGVWTLDARLTVPEAARQASNAYFGWQNAVALSGRYAAVGSKGLEAVFVFHLNETAGAGAWGLHQTLRSSDFHSYRAVPVVAGVPTTYVLQQEFGCSVAMSLTTLAVGARRANYVANRSLGKGGLSAKGAVYTFFPHDQEHLGCFVDATDRDFEVEVAARDPALSVAKCEALCSDYEYYALQRGMYCFCSDEYPGYAPADAASCDSVCTDAASGDAPGACGGVWFNSVYRNVHATHHNQSGLVWVEHSKLTSSDGVMEDFFGAVVALDNDTLVASAWKNPATSQATWNFERGDLAGWLTTGDAFDNQPTFGETVLYRTVYGQAAINLTTSGVYSRWANMHPFGNGSAFAARPDDFESTVGNETTEEECTLECDALGDDCLGFLRSTTTGSADDTGLCTVIRRADFEPYGIQQANVTAWPGGAMHLKQGAEPFFLYTKPRDRFPRYFDFEGVQSNVKVRPQGSWWVGTYENHPADGPVAEWGAAQGDEPTGTMASTPFVVGGVEISFLIGGGCDVRKIFAELVVDRRRVRVATGECRETMRRVRWNVAEFAGKAAVLRVADLAAGTWGHVNFDDVRFSWRVEGRSGDFEDDLSTQTASAGAAYVFRRHAPGDELAPCACECALRVPEWFKQNLAPMRSGESFEEHCLCANDKWDCEWAQEVKLEASDKAAQAYFGQSVAVSQEHGLIAVGAHNALSQDQFGEEDDAANGDGGGNGDGDRKRLLHRGAGAVYLFTRQEEYRDAFGAQVHYASWAQDYAHALRGYADLEEMLTDPAANANFPTDRAVSTERLRLQSTGPRAGGDMFGYSVAVAEDRVVVGAPGAGYAGYAAVAGSGGVVRAGAAYVFQSEFRTVQFSQRSAVVAEADPGDHDVHAPGYRLVSHVTWLSVELTRSGDATQELEVAYATSDVTARGVTPDEASVCLATPYRNRTSEVCGDYVHTKGTARFLPRETLTQIVVPIMDDECAEGTEAFQLQLLAVGGDALMGELYHMTIEIDDNDLGQSTC